MRKRGKTLKHGHREKEEGESHAKGEEEQMRGKKNTPQSEEDEGVSTEMQQDQIRAGRLFILVNTTPRIYLKFKTQNTGHFNTMGSISSATLASSVRIQSCNSARCARVLLC